MSLSTRLQEFAARISVEFNSVRASIGNLTNLGSSHKTTIVGSINEVRDVALAAAVIDDEATNLTNTWSSNKITGTVDTAIANLVDSSPEVMNTLNELAAALGDDPNFATTMSDALGNRVRVDAPQAFAALQMAQGRANIDAASATEVGDTAVDLVAAFNAALVQPV